MIPLLSPKQLGQPVERQPVDQLRLGISSISLSGDGKLTVKFSRPIMRPKVESMLLSDDDKRLLASESNPIEQVFKAQIIDS